MIFPRATLFVLAAASIIGSALSAGNTTPEPEAKARATIQSFAPENSLYNRKCGEVFDIETSKDVITQSVHRMIYTADVIFNNPQFSGSTYTNYFGPSNNATRPWQTYMATNGIKGMKVCAKCSDFRQKLRPRYRGEYDAFCAGDAYGIDSTVSGLALIPVDGEGNILSGELEGAVWYRGIQSFTFDGPSSRWPTTDEGGLLGASDEWYASTTMLGGMMMAGAGQVVVMPDGIGYGESSDCYKGLFAKQLYKTATVPLYLATKQIIAESTGCESDLSNTVSVNGYSEGGYATVSAAEGLSSVGFEVTVARAGAASIQHKKQIELETIRLLQDKIADRFIWIFPLLMGSLSSTVTGLSNFGDLNQSYLSQEGRLRLLPFVLAGFKKFQDLAAVTKFAIGTTGTGANAENLNTRFLNPEIVEYAKTGQLFCENDELDDLCNTLEEATLTDSITQAPYPTSLCHSFTDELIIFSTDFPTGVPPTNSGFLVTDWGTFDPTSAPLHDFYGHAQAQAVCTVAYALDAIDTTDTSFQSVKTNRCERFLSK